MTPFKGNAAVLAENVYLRPDVAVGDNCVVAIALNYNKGVTFARSLGDCRESEHF